MKKVINTLIVVAVVSFAIVSCKKKDNSVDVETETVTVETDTALVPVETIEQRGDTTITHQDTLEVQETTVTPQ